MKVGIDYGIIYAVYCIVSKKWYVGQTMHDLLWRKGKHYNAAAYRDGHFQNALRKYGKDCFIWIVVEDNISVPYHYENGKKVHDKTLLNVREKYWVDYYDSFHNGYNMTLGGDGTQAFNTKAINQYERDTLKFIRRFSSIVEAEQVTGISATNIIYCAKRKTTSAGGSIWCYDNEKPNTYISPTQKKPIAQYTLNGELINCYSGIKEAARETKILYTKIIRCLKGDRPSAGGFMWRYIIDGNIIEKIDPYKKKTNIDKRKKICQYTKDGVFIKQFDSCTEAAKEVGISNGKITLCANGKRPLAGGYGWAYAS